MDYIIIIGITALSVNTAAVVRYSDISLLCIIAPIECIGGGLRWKKISSETGILP